MIQYVYAFIAASTMTITLSGIFFLYHKRHSDISLKFFAVVIFVLSMMGSMLNALTYYLITPKNFLDTVVAFNISMEIMIIAIVVLGYIGTTGKFVHDKMTDLTVDFLTVWNEGSMGVFLFSLLIPKNGSSYAFLINMISGGLSLYFFIIPMLVEMLFLYVLVKNEIIRTKMLVLLVASLFPPTFLGDSKYVSSILVLFIITMSISAAILLWKGLIKMENGKMFFRTFYIPIIILGLMLLGVIVGIGTQFNFYVSWLPFAMITLISMTYYFYLALNGD